MSTLPLMHISFTHCMGSPCLADSTLTLREQDGKELQRIARVFDSNIRFLSSDPINTIPEKLHFVWLGSKTLRQDCFLSWQELHNDWQIHFWTDNAEAIVFPGVTTHLIQDELKTDPVYSYIMKSDNVAEKADLVRYAVLFAHGGVYADLDVKCKRSFKHLVSHFDFVTGLEQSHFHRSIDSSIVPANALIAARAAHPILFETLQRIYRIWDELEKQFPGTDRLSVFNRVIGRTFDSFAFTSKSYLESDRYRNLILPALCFHSEHLIPKSQQEDLISQGIIYAIHLSHPSGNGATSHGESWLPPPALTTE